MRREDRSDEPSTGSLIVGLIAAIGFWVTMALVVRGLDSCDPKKQDTVQVGK